MSASERFLYLYLFLFVHLVVVEETTAVECKKINDCECIKSDGKVMSLKPIDRTSGPKFTDIPGTKKGQPGRTFQFSWNPCTKFSDDNCKNVLLCQQENTATTPVADEASTFDEATDGSITLTYKGVKANDGYTRTAVIKLICDKDEYPGKFGKFVEVEGPEKTGEYFSTFHSKCVCDEGCSPTGGSAIYEKDTVH